MLFLLAIQSYFKAELVDCGYYDGGGREEGGGDPGILAFSASSYIIREGG